MLKNTKDLCGWCPKDFKAIYGFWRQKIVEQDESDGDSEFTITIRLEANQQVERQIEENFEDGEQYAGLTKTPS